MSKLKNGRNGLSVLVTIALGLYVAAPGSSFAGRATRTADAIWANGDLYGTVATDTNFKSPPPHSTDIIFSFGGSGLDGHRSVAEAAPGDRDYNGGRWNVMAVSFTEVGLALFDENGDGMVDFELTSAEMVLDYAEMGLLTISSANFYFECPLLPQRNR